MICPKCGASNEDKFVFCTKCGTKLQETAETAVNLEEGVSVKPLASDEPVNIVSSDTPVENVQQIEPELVKPLENGEPVNVVPESPSESSETINTIQEPKIESNVQRENTNVTSEPLNYINYLIAFMLKPCKAFKNEEGKFANTKTALIFSACVAGIMTLVTLLKAMLGVIFTKSMDFSTFKYKTTINFSGLKNLDYMSLIFRNLLIYVSLIAVIALIYFVLGLIFKKKVNYIKMLTIAANSLIPFIIAGMIVAPLLGKIWAPLEMVLLVASAVYSILIFLNLTADVIVFDNKDLKIYFHLICLTILVSAGYYVYMQVMVSSITNSIGDLGDLGDLFNIIG